jgi:hypothetical protein
MRITDGLEALLAIGGGSRDGDGIAEGSASTELGTLGKDEGLAALVIILRGGGRDSDGTVEGGTSEEPASPELDTNGLMIVEVIGGGDGGASVSVEGVKLSTGSEVVMVEKGIGSGIVDTKLLKTNDGAAVETTMLGSRKDDTDSTGPEATAEPTRRVLAMLDVELSPDVDAASDELGTFESNPPKLEVPSTKQTT